MDNPCHQASQKATQVPGPPSWIAPAPARTPTSTPGPALLPGPEPWSSSAAAFTQHKTPNKGPSAEEHQASLTPARDSIVQETRKRRPQCLCQAPRRQSGQRTECGQPGASECLASLQRTAPPHWPGRPHVWVPSNSVRLQWDLWSHRLHDKAAWTPSHVALAALRFLGPAGFCTGLSLTAAQRWPGQTSPHFSPFALSSAWSPGRHPQSGTSECHGTDRRHHSLGKSSTRCPWTSLGGTCQDTEAAWVTMWQSLCRSIQTGGRRPDAQGRLGPGVRHGLPGAGCRLLASSERAPVCVGAEE